MISEEELKRRVNSVLTAEFKGQPISTNMVGKIQSKLMVLLQELQDEGELDDPASKIEVVQDPHDPTMLVVKGLENFFNLLPE